MVSVLSEDGNAMRNVNPAAITMRMWKGQGHASRLPASVSLFTKNIKILKSYDFKKLSRGILIRSLACLFNC